jgi:hypothetical protein
MLDDRELPLLCSVEVAKSLFAQMATATRCLRCFEVSGVIAVKEHVLSGPVELLTC